MPTSKSEDVPLQRRSQRTRKEINYNENNVSLEQRKSAVITKVKHTVKAKEASIDVNKPAKNVKVPTKSAASKRANRNQSKSNADQPVVKKSKIKSEKENNQNSTNTAKPKCNDDSIKADNAQIEDNSSSVNNLIAGGTDSPEMLIKSGTTILDKTYVIFNNDSDMTKDSVDKENEMKDFKGSDKIKIQNDKSSENQDLVKVQYRGNVPVDPYFDCASCFIVYRDHSNMDWDCMLNQTNVGKNNNKFYVIQLLTGNSEFRIFKRWGRIGEKGQKNIESFSNIDDAKSCFINLFKRKTGVKWDTNIYANFQKCHGKYDLIQRDFAVDDKYESEPVEIKIPESTLSKDVQELIALICNESLIITSLKELNYDASKAPLGKLSTHQIELGYSALKEIEQCILGNASSSYLKEACSLYYTRIPHVFRRSGIELIDTIQRLKEELNLLSSLDDARAAVKMFAQECSSVNPIDRHYEQLNCGIKLLSHDFEIFTKIKESLISTHAVKNHGFKIEVIDVFELEKSIEAFNDVGNKRLLWHGSRLMNFAGILGRGLKIAPPEAPSTGYMFGKGVYFADVSSKSAQYCYACSSNSTCFMLLAEVSLGESHRLLSSEHRLPKLLPKGKHSTHGVGKWIPAGTDYIQGLPIPKGPIVQQGKDLLKDGKLASLQFNEFIVYSTSQIRLRYLVKLKISN